ncbi:MAG: hypothetical protein M3459_09145 [Actinomycetota bacterium]|nr:hypothetical protein [Actinomycetota bacterium]
MATLLDLTSQGDVATITDESKLANIQLQTPQQLYELWERQQWQAHAIELDRDVSDWAAFPDEERADVLWACRRSSWARSASRPSSPGWSWPTTTSPRRPS